MSEETERMSVEQLEGLLQAPDLSKRERRELQRAVRFHRRIEVWEARRATYTPPKTHRVVVTVLMMLLSIALLVLLIKG